MEQLLGKFQSDLGRVSEEIRQLQVQSQTMSTKLKNRRATEQQLGSFIENMTVSEHMVLEIMDSEASARMAWLSHKMVPAFGVSHEVLLIPSYATLSYAWA